MIMTPINFVTFLVSLYIVDRQYMDERVRRHGPRHAQAPSMQPSASSSSWLQRLLYTPRPYEWVDRRPAPPNRDDERYYYHSKQKKLMKMEAADAFALRRPVILGLALLAALALLLAARLGAWVFGRLALYRYGDW
jgi:hypothetical protein